MLITQVEPGSPAWDKGLREGMIIRSVNRVRTANAEELRQVLDTAGDADSILLLVHVPRYGSRYAVIPLND